MNEQRGAITLLPQKRSMVAAVERLWENSSRHVAIVEGTKPRSCQSNDETFSRAKKAKMIQPEQRSNRWLVELAQSQAGSGSRIFLLWRCVGIVSKESAEQRLLDAMLLALPSLSKYSIPTAAACEPHDLLGYNKDRISSHSEVYPYPREIYDPAFL